MFNTHYLIKVPKGLAPDPAWHTTSAELGSHQPRLLVVRGRIHSATKHSQWDAKRKRSIGLFLVTDCRDFCSASQEILNSNSLLASFKREPVYRFFSHIRRTHITVMRRWHSFSSLIPHRYSQTHSQRRCLEHKSFSVHGDRCVYSIPRFQPGIDPFIGHPSRNGKMPVYRAPCICSPIYRDTTTSMTWEPSAKPPHPSLFGIAKRRTSSRYQSEGRWQPALKISWLPILVQRLKPVLYQRSASLSFRLSTDSQIPTVGSWYAVLDRRWSDCWFLLGLQLSSPCTQKSVTK